MGLYPTDLPSMGSRIFAVDPQSQTPINKYAVRNSLIISLVSHAERIFQIILENKNSFLIRCRYWQDREDCCPVCVLTSTTLLFEERIEICSAPTRVLQ